MSKHCQTPCPQKPKADYLLWIGLAITLITYSSYWLEKLLNYGSHWHRLSVFSSTIAEFVHASWIGVLVGLIFIGLLNKIPRDFIVAALGKSTGLNGILRATGAGVVLDLCSHGILMVGMKLYERGASLGKVMAFLIASPWNSFSLTLILWGLIGFWWMLAFLTGSLIIAIISGVIFEYLVDRGKLPQNPHQVDLPDGFNFWKEAKEQFQQSTFTKTTCKDILIDGLKGSRLILRWLLVGIILVGLIRSFVPEGNFYALFSPTLAGLGLTLFFATVIEVCSEGSVPIAADLLNQSKAPGNAFAFLMTGVSSDYTEVMVLKSSTKSWKIALFLPLVTIPQIFGLALLLNTIY